MKLLITLLFAILLPSCASLSDIIDTGSAAKEKARKAIEKVCNSENIGSIKKKLKTAKSTELWLKMCKEKQGLDGQQ